MGVGAGFAAAQGGTAFFNRPDASKPGKSHEHGGDFGSKKGTEAVAGGGGDFCGHPGRHSPFGSYEYSGLASDGTGLECHHPFHSLSSPKLERSEDSRIIGGAMS